MNITDVWHLTDDGDQGQDKMEKWAKKEWLTVWQVAKRYEDRFLHYMKEFQLKPFDVNPRATEHINEQISMVNKLREFWYTYIIEWDGIYMDTSKISDYGKLAKLDIEGLSSQYRGEGAHIDSVKKKQITDFALWKFSPKDEKRWMEWIFDGPRAGALLVDSEKDLPWNNNSDNKKWDFALRSTVSTEEEATRWFPGRHIECSAMSVKYLGEQFDIHTWWVDHIPVHHTNEIAQTECCYQKKPWVNYWLHQQFLQMDGGKMSKSKGHDLSVPWIEKQGYSPLDVRYFFLTAHYRSFLDFTWEALDSARATRANMIKKIAQHNLPSLDSIKNHTPGVFYNELAHAMADDLDTVKVLAVMHSHINQLPNGLEDLLLFDQHITKLNLWEGANQLQLQTAAPIPANIVELAEKRLEAKRNKDFANADMLRQQVSELWRDIKDTSEGYEISRQ